MPTVTPMFVSTIEATQAGEEYLRSYRPRDRDSLEQRRLYRAAADSMHLFCQSQGVKNIRDADARQRRRIFIWLRSNMRPE